MRKRVKKFIMVFIISVVFQGLKYSTVLAADTISSSSNLQGVAIDKTWKINFSEELDPGSIKSNVKIIDKETNKELESNIKLEGNNRTVNVTSNYVKNKKYKLVINKNIKSKTNKYMNETISKDFTTSKETNTITVINSIDNINFTVGDDIKFNLPSKLNALMSDGSTKKVNVEWDKNIEIVQTPGKYVFYGTVSNYDKKVQFNLTVVSRKGNEVNLVEENKPYENNKTSKNNELREEPSKESHSVLHKNLYNYLMNEENRESVMKRAIELHDGDLSNNCVYFASEGLRRAGLKELPEYVCNTVQLTKKLNSMGWETSRDFSKLLPGDICFTKSYGAGPTHTYVFMKWANPKKYDYAYICDNQGNEYGSIYHKRNVNFATETKDPTVYFMYKPSRK